VSNNVKKTAVNLRRLTLAALLSAAGCVILLAGSLVDVLDLSCAALASLVIVLARIELGQAYSLGAYGVISVISLLLFPTKFVGLAFFAFFGFYPIIKAAFERRHPAVSWVFKFSAFYISVFAVYMLGKYLFNLPDFSGSLLPDEIFGVAVPQVVTGGQIAILGLIVLGVMFLLYDIALSRIIMLYIVKLRKLLKLKPYF